MLRKLQIKTSLSTEGRIPLLQVQVTPMSHCKLLHWARPSSLFGVYFLCTLAAPQSVTAAAKERDPSASLKQTKIQEHNIPTEAAPSKDLAQSPAMQTNTPFVAYELQLINKRLYAKNNLPTPGFELDAVVYILDKGMTQVLSKARVTRATYSASTKQHFIELVVLEPPQAVNQPILFNQGFAVPATALLGALAHLKPVAGVNLPTSSSSGSDVNPAGNASLFTNHANPIATVAYYSRQHIFAAVPLLFGAGSAVTSLGSGVELEIFPPGIASANWVNWMGFGFRYFKSFKSELETFNFIAKKTQKYILTNTTIETVFYFRPTFNTFWLPRFSLEIVPWRSDKETYSEQNASSVFENSSNGQRISVSIEASLFSSLLLQVNGVLPLKTTTKLQAKNKQGETQRSEGKQSIKAYGALLGVRHQFAITSNKLSAEVWGGVEQQQKSIQSEIGNSQSGNKVSPLFTAKVGFIL